MGCTNILWTTDAPIDFSPILRTAAFYDYRFCQGSEAVQIFSEKEFKSHLLPMACSPEFHYQVDLSINERQTLSHDVVFVGSYYPNRSELFEKLVDLDLAIWGPGWNQLKKTSKLRKHLQGSHSPPALWRKIYSSAKIVLAPHYQNSKFISEVHQASPRIFEAMACGAFVLTDKQKDVLGLFETGVHLESYSDINELKEKICYFLSHHDERKRIANQGQQEVLANHTYENRIEYLISILEDSVHRQ